ncbi:hypothetical protein GCM10022393_29780 [Aquimarina addita]|uniref:Translation elongation factor EFTu/EF1A C-terminal domain-containing protein n=1 Tax=Aquimarina addita TaxID=870485 RepID=A0ABP6UN28_9FLAO
MKKSDFIAELRFQATEKGGRKEYVTSGYRPHIEFENYPEYLTSGQQTYIGTDFVLPGETVFAKIEILSTKYFTKRLYINMKFKFSEGSHTIGYGTIIKINNKSLMTDPNINQASINLNFIHQILWTAYNQILDKITIKLFLNFKS